jgi:hypothetical protein
MARARVTASSVGAEHRAERDVLGARGRHEPTRELGRLEHHGEVLGLRRTDDVDDACGS